MRVQIGRVDDGTAKTVRVEIVQCRGAPYEVDEDMLDVDFGRWLAGEDLPVSHLGGQLGGMAKPFKWPPRRRGRALAAE